MFLSHKQTFRVPYECRSYWGMFLDSSKTDTHFPCPIFPGQVIAMGCSKVLEKSPMGKIFHRIFLIIWNIQDLSKTKKTFVHKSNSRPKWKQKLFHHKLYFFSFSIQRIVNWAVWYTYPAAITLTEHMFPNACNKTSALTILSQDCFINLGS